MKIRIIVLIFFTLAGIASWAQGLGSCSQALRLASSSYDQGKLGEIPNILKSCLEATDKKDSFTKQERIDALKLLILTYIYQDNPKMADETMLKLLQFDNYFVPNKDVDPAELMALYKTFRTDPIYRLGFVFSGVLSFNNVKSSDVATNGTAKYSYRFMGFSAGIRAEVPYRKNWLATAELNYLNQVFKNSVIVSNDITHASESIKSTAVVQTNESKQSLSTIQLPIMAGYVKKLNNNVAVNFSLGGEINYTIAARNKLNLNRKVGASVEEKIFSSRPSYTPLFFNGIASINARLNTKRGQLIAELRYRHGFQKISTPYSDESILWTRHYQDGVFSLNSVSLHIAYVVDVFNPKKKKPAPKRKL